jgi:hypothetical protein
MSRRRTKPDQLPLFARPLLKRGAVDIQSVFARPDMAQNSSGAKSAGKPEAARAASPGPIVMAKEEKKVAMTGTAGKSVGASPARHPLSFYTGEVSDRMFSAPQPPPPPPPPPLPKPKPVKVEVPDINPFEDWAYTGTMRQGDEITALIENTKTKEGQFLKQGDTFMGAKAVSITAQMVTLTAGGKPRMLAKSDTTNVTQLSKDAVPNTPQQQGPPPGPPGMPPGMPGMGPGRWGGGGMVTLPNGMQMPAGMAGRRNRRMNFQFNQGG